MYQDVEPSEPMLLRALHNKIYTWSKGYIEILEDIVINAVNNWIQEERAAKERILHKISLNLFEALCAAVRSQQ